LAYRGFQQEGFEIVAAFDQDTERKRRQKDRPHHSCDENLPSLSAARREDGHRDRAAAAAQEVANIRRQSGNHGILNFAPIVPTCSEEVIVNNVNLAIELEKP